ncbi:hypothetical protein [Parabacteroides pacaensis]|uniref:hypothetical protein n=1 Tax=Parabacteroides pacaensis TaxID=2086575 RepID=UPI000D111506|nr:hypothetical protein [Parabacteroides pacaensis]
MKKNVKLVKYALMGVLSFGLVSTTFTSCKDYDDDIDNINQKLDKVVSDLAELQTKVGQFVKSVTYDATTGELVVVDNNDQTVRTKIGQNLPSYTLEVTADGKVILKKDGTAISTEQITFPTPTPAPKFEASKLTVDPTTNKVMYDGQPTGVTLPTASTSGCEGSITEIKEGDVVVGYTITIDDKSCSFSLTDALPLKSMVFVPQSYLGGVQAMDINSLVYNPITIARASATVDETWTKATAVNTISPAAYAEYHLNPSSVTKAQIKSLNVTWDNPEYYTRAAGNFAPTAVLTDVENGLLKATINLNSDKVANADESQISVFALQAVLKAKGTAGQDTVVTSDYAAINKIFMKDFILANPNVNAIDGAHDTLANHLRTNVATMTPENAVRDTALVYNDKTGIDLKGLVETHVTKYIKKANGEEVVTSTDKKISEVQNYGLDYKFELYSYKVGSNQTDQSSYADLTADGVITAKVFDAGQGTAAIDKAPIVRVTLVDKKTNSIVAVAYIKVKITRTAPQTVKATFDFGEFYQLCGDKKLNVTVEQMNVDIYNKLGLSKDDFHRLYTFAGDAVTGDGSVAENEDPETTATTLLIWTLPEATVWNDADGQFEAKVTYKATGRDDVVITLKAQAKRPSITLTNAMKIAEYWDDAKTFVKLNVAVPDAGSTDPTKCTFVVDLDNAFVLKNGAVDFASLLDSHFTNYEPLAYEYVFTPANVRTIDGHNITVSADQKQLLVGTEVIATIATDGTNNISYGNGTVAKALLNRDDPFSATIGFNVKNACGHKIPLTNETFVAKFLRPVNVDPEASKGFIDAVDFGAEGSIVDMLDIVKLSDWRNYKFYGTNGHPNYYQYYDVTAIKVDIDNITSNLNGDNFTKKITDFTQIEIAQDNTGVNPAQPFYGKLTYKNNGNAVGAFKMKVPVIVTYKWGDVKANVIVDVAATVNQ